MRIDRIKIKNFKGFAKEEFKLNPKFTVFIGDNAKGKTSILDALAVAAGSFFLGVKIVKSEARGIARNEIRVKTIDGQPRPQLPVEIRAFGEVNGIEIKEGWLRTVEDIDNIIETTSVRAKNIEIIAKDMVSESRSEGGVTFPVIAYHGTGRLWAENGETRYEREGEGIEAAYAKCLSPKSSSKEFLSWYKTFEDEVRKFGTEDEKLFLETFNRSIISMIPDNNWEDMAYSFRNEDLIGIFTNSEGKKEKLLFSQLSDGYRNVIGMVADIAYRCLKLNPHLGAKAVEETPGIVLIDELDLHLHPNWQRRIVGDLKNTFKKIQFVATTHSPFIVQSLESDELINLDRATDVKLKDLSIDEVAENVMGTPSDMSVENANDEELAFRYLNELKASSEKSKQDIIAELDEIELRISDPAARALLQMKRLEKIPE